MRNDFWIGRDSAAMTPPFMLTRKGPATEGERATLVVPGLPPPPGRREPGEPNAWKGRGR